MRWVDTRASSGLGGVLLRRLKRLYVIPVWHEHFERLTVEFLKPNHATRDARFGSDFSHLLTWHHDWPRYC